MRENASPLKHPWWLLLLLVVSIFINFIDRSNLSVAAEDLRRELVFGPAQMGLLLSAFFWTYAACQVGAGWMVDRFNVYWLYAAGFFLWSAATGATGLVTGFAQLFALRLLLGIGESVAYPSYSRILASGFPERQRGFCNAAIDAGSKLGPALGTLVGGLIISHSGWRFLFIALGVGALLWLVPWTLSIPKNLPVRSVHRVAGPGFGALLKQRKVWGSFAGLFAINWAWYFLVTWLPSYLRLARGYTTESMAVYGSLPYLSIGLCSLFFGWFSDWLIGRGLSVSLVRRGFAASGLICAGLLMLPAVLVRDATHALILLSVAAGVFGLSTSNIWAITQRLAGAEAAGTWTGAQNAFGNLAGVVGPWITGVLVQSTGSFVAAFALVTFVMVAGACSFLIFIRDLEPVAWTTRANGVSS